MQRLHQNKTDNTDFTDLSPVNICRKKYLWLISNSVAVITMHDQAKHGNHFLPLPQRTTSTRKNPNTDLFKHGPFYQLSKAYHFLNHGKQNILL